jgi:hypothetical protein
LAFDLNAFLKASGISVRVGKDRIKWISARNVVLLDCREDCLKCTVGNSFEKRLVNQTLCVGMSETTIVTNNAYVAEPLVTTLVLKLGY